MRRRAARGRSRPRPAAAGGRGERKSCIGGVLMGGTYPGAKCAGVLSAMKMTRATTREREPLQRVAEVPLGPKLEGRAPDALVAVGTVRIEQHDARLDRSRQCLLEVGSPREEQHSRPVPVAGDVRRADAHARARAAGRDVRRPRRGSSVTVTSGSLSRLRPSGTQPRSTSSSFALPGRDERRQHAVARPARRSRACCRAAPGAPDRKCPRSVTCW